MLAQLGRAKTVNPVGLLQFDVICNPARFLWHRLVRSPLSFVELDRCINLQNTVLKGYGLANVGQHVSEHSGIKEGLEPNGAALLRCSDGKRSNPRNLKCDDRRGFTCEE